VSPSAIPKIEIAGILTVTRFVEFNPYIQLSNQEDPDHRYKLEHWLECGIGGRFTMNLSRSAGLQAEVVGYPRFAGTPSWDTGYRGWGKIAVLAGPQLRFQLVGIHTVVVARAGALRYGRMPAITLSSRDNRGRTVFAAVIDNYAATFPAADVGAGITGQVSKRFGLQLETGDLVVRYAPEPRDLNPTFLRHNWHLDFALTVAF
jgi:hypothetical protein